MRSSSADMLASYLAKTGNGRKACRENKRGDGAKSRQEESRLVKKINHRVESRKVRRKRRALVMNTKTIRWRGVGALMRRGCQKRKGGSRKAKIRLEVKQHAQPQNLTAISSNHEWLSQSRKGAAWPVHWALVGPTEPSEHRPPVTVRIHFTWPSWLGKLFLCQLTFTNNRDKKKRQLDLHSNFLSLWQRQKMVAAGCKTRPSILDYHFFSKQPFSSRQQLWTVMVPISQSSTRIKTHHFKVLEDV